MLRNHLLSALVFAPWIGAFVLTVLRPRRAAARVIALMFSLSTLALLAVSWRSLASASALPVIVAHHLWIASLNIHYHLALDGLSLVLVLLTAIVSPAALLAGWRQERALRITATLLLLLQGAALGVFVAMDFFAWFLFWELSLIPAYFLIRLGRTETAARAAYQFVVYTVAGSAAMLVAFGALYAITGTLNFADLAQLARDGELARRLTAGGAWWPRAIFAGILLGVAVKAPLWPFHTWLPSAYAEAPTGGSVFLSAVMSKMGVYGFLRLLWPLFPDELHAAAPWLLWLALGGVVLGALAALRQTDLKRMLAYSSLNHVSYCLLALFAVAGASRGLPDHAAVAAALSGIVFQVFAHGLSASSLFLCAGLLEERAAVNASLIGRPAGQSGIPLGRSLDDYGGVRAVAPVFAGLAGFALFASLGLPGLSGFVGEYLIFRGVFGIAPWAAGVACLGLLVTALFLLTFWLRVFHGPRRGAASGSFRDVTGPELATLAPLAALMLALGLVPHLLTGLYNPLVTAWTSHGP